MSQNNTEDHHLMNNEDNQKNNEDLLNDSLSGIESQTDLDNLLDNYGIDVETPEKMAYKDRIDKMRRRVINDVPTAEQQIKEKKSIAPLFWLLGCVLMFVGIIFQYIIFNMNSLVKESHNRENLVAVCSVLQCSVPNANLKDIHINRPKFVPSTVVPSSGQTDIIASLTNNSDDTQLYPNLRVTIKGISTKKTNDLSTSYSEIILGEFIAKPEDYLTSKDQIKFSAKQESLFMFTVPVKSAHITKVDINPFY